MTQFNVPTKDEVSGRNQKLFGELEKQDLETQIRVFVSGFGIEDPRVIVKPPGRFGGSTIKIDFKEVIPDKLRQNLNSFLEDLGIKCFGLNVISWSQTEDTVIRFSVCIAN